MGTQEEVNKLVFKHSEKLSNDLHYVAPELRDEQIRKRMLQLAIDVRVLMETRNVKL